MAIAQKTTDKPPMSAIRVRVLRRLLTALATLMTVAVGYGAFVTTHDPMGLVLVIPATMVIIYSVNSLTRI